jgi:fructose-specific phosphotransferase system component IIB
MSSPTSETVKLSKKELKKKIKSSIKDLIDYFDEIVKLNRKVMEVPEGIVLPNGIKFNKTLMNSYNAAYKDALANLYKEISEGLSKKKALQKPAFYTGEFLNFVKTADFGFYYSFGPNGECVKNANKLSDMLVLAKQYGIMLTGSAISLLSLYLNVHNLRYGTRKYKADDYLRNVFAQTFESLRQKDLQAGEKRVKVRGSTTGETEIKEPFNPDAIDTSDFIIIVAESKIKKASLTPEKAQYLINPEVDDKARLEGDMIRSTLDCVHEEYELLHPKTRVSASGKIVVVRRTRKSNVKRPKTLLSPSFTATAAQYAGGVQYPATQYAAAQYVPVQYTVEGVQYPATQYAAPAAGGIQQIQQM